MSVKRESGMEVRSSNKTTTSKTQSMHADVLIRGAETDREEEEGQEEKRDANTILGRVKAAAPHPTITHTKDKDTAVA